MRRKSVEIRARIEPELKEEATRVLDNLGLSMSEAMRLLLRQVVKVKGLSFAPSQTPSPNRQTIAAMVEARTITTPRFKTSSELFASFDKGMKDGTL